MKKIFGKAKKIGTVAAVLAMTAFIGVKVAAVARAKKILSENKGEGFVDTAVKILMAVVIGALVLAGLYLLFSGTILPELTRRIQEMFNYRG
jgi:ABC-type antimicrobial peptide transport system permease subunit